MKSAGDAMLGLEMATLILSVPAFATSCFLLYRERSMKTADGSVKFLFRRLACISLGFLVLERCVGVARAVEGDSASLARAALFFQAGVIIGIFMAGQAYLFYSIKSLLLMTAPIFPQEYGRLFNGTTIGTYAIFILLTTIAVSVDRVVIVYIFFYLLLFILMILNVMCAFVLRKIFRHYLDSSMRLRSGATQDSRKKALRRTVIFLCTWYFVWLLFFIVFISQAWTWFGEGLQRGISFDEEADEEGTEIDFTVILFVLLLFVPYLGLTWYAWIPKHSLEKNGRGKSSTDGSTAGSNSNVTSV